jgi:PD-(D/E)XK endonuclease
MRTSVRIVEMTPTRKGGIAELKFIARAVELGYEVYTSVIEGGRYDFILDDGEQLLRVQCKTARLRGSVLDVQLATSRLTPHGYVRTTYDSSQVDAVAAYSPDLDACYLIPIAKVAGRKGIYLRLRPTLNNQSAAVSWAEQYRLGAIAQLGERCHGMAEVEGSSPSSSTIEAAPQGGLFDVYEEEHANGSPRG